MVQAMGGEAWPGHWAPAQERLRSVGGVQWCSFVLVFHLDCPLNLPRACFCVLIREGHEAPMLSSS